MHRLLHQKTLKKRSFVLVWSQQLKLISVLCSSTLLFPCRQRQYEDTQQGGGLLLDVTLVYRSTYSSPTDTLVITHYHHISAGNCQYLIMSNQCQITVCDKKHTMFWKKMRPYSAGSGVHGQTHLNSAFWPGLEFFLDNQNVYLLQILAFAYIFWTFFWSLVFCTYFNIIKSDIQVTECSLWEFSVWHLVGLEIKLQIFWQESFLIPGAFKTKDVCFFCSAIKVVYKYLIFKIIPSSKKVFLFLHIMMGMQTKQQSEMLTSLKNK